MGLYQILKILNNLLKDKFPNSYLTNISEMTLIEVLIVALILFFLSYTII
jgi:hypothetical protein